MDKYLLTPGRGEGKVRGGPQPLDEEVRKTEKLGEMKQHLLDMNNDMAPMKVWQLQDLSTQAAQRIMASPADERLKVMSDLASNFPSHARSLSRTSVPKELKKEVMPPTPKKIWSLLLKKTINIIRMLLLSVTLIL